MVLGQEENIELETRGCCSRKKDLLGKNWLPASEQGKERITQEGIGDFGRENNNGKQVSGKEPKEKSSPKGPREEAFKPLDRFRV